MHKSIGSMQSDAGTIQGLCFQGQRRGEMGLVSLYKRERPKASKANKKSNKKLSPALAAVSGESG